MWLNTVIVCTHWSNDKKKKRERAKKKATEEDWTIKLNQELKAEFQFNVEIPLFFIDNSYEVDSEDIPLEEISDHKKSLQDLRNFVRRCDNFSCEGLLKHLSQVAQLKVDNEKEREKMAMMEREREEVERNNEQEQLKLKTQLIMSKQEMQERIYAEELEKQKMKNEIYEYEHQVFNNEIAYLKEEGRRQEEENRKLKQDYESVRFENSRLKNTQQNMGRQLYQVESRRWGCFIF